MPSLERFFDPQMRKFDANVRPLPGARLYFFENGTTTPKTVYKDKQGALAHNNPVIADSTGVFPQIFLDGLYRVELRSSSNIVQPGWPIDNIGQDTPVVPFGPWVEVNTYNEGEVVTGSNGNWYRSLIDENLGNDPISSPTEWEVIPIPVASSYTSNKTYLTWADDGDQVSLNVDTAGLVDEIEANIDEIDGSLTIAENASVGGNLSVIGDATIGNDIDIVGGATVGGIIDVTGDASIGGNLELTGTITSASFKSARRSTSKTIFSSTTLEKDTSLVLTGLEPNAFYYVKALLSFRTGAVATNGYKVRLQMDSGSKFIHFAISNGDVPGTPSPTISTWSNTDAAERDFTTINADEPIFIEAYMRPGTGITEIYVEWAQKTSSPTGTSLVYGLITATKL